MVGNEGIHQRVPRRWRLRRRGRRPLQAPRRVATDSEVWGQAETYGRQAREAFRVQHPRTAMREEHKRTSTAREGFCHVLTRAIKEGHRVADRNRRQSSIPKPPPLEIPDHNKYAPAPIIRITVPIRRRVIDLDACERELWRQIGQEQFKETLRGLAIDAIKLHHRSPPSWRDA